MNYLSSRPEGRRTVAEGSVSGFGTEAVFRSGAEIPPLAHSSLGRDDSFIGHHRFCESAHLPLCPSAPLPLCSFAPCGMKRSGLPCGFGAGAAPGVGR